MPLAASVSQKAKGVRVVLWLQNCAYMHWILGTGFRTVPSVCCLLPKKGSQAVHTQDGLAPPANAF
jgi:hypothetical protein